MKTILITGSSGFIGNHLAHELSSHYNIVGLDTKSIAKSGCHTFYMIDITNQAQITEMFAKHKFDYVIHSAAEKSLIDCETKQGEAYDVNFTSSKLLYDLTRSQKGRFVFISSDQVFDGIEGNYDEQADANPINYYGVLKEKFENVIKNDTRSTICRTALVFGAIPENQRNYFNQIRSQDNLVVQGYIVQHVLHKLRRQEEIRLSDNEFITPTSVELLCLQLKQVIKHNVGGILHCCGGEKISRYNFGRKIAKKFQLDNRCIKASSTNNRLRPIDVSLNHQVSMEKLAINYWNVNTMLTRLKDKMTGEYNEDKLMIDYKFQWPSRMEEMGGVVKEYIDSGKPLSIADDGGVYRELETKFATLHGRKYGLLVSSGTMALYSAFFALNLLPGDEVICTAYSYHATAAPLLHFGVKIVFCDVEPDVGNIDVSCIEPLISDRTKAIIANDQWGHPCDKDVVLAICKKYNLKYVEDCSHAHFSEYKGKYCGSFGDVACWSLQGNKLLTGGEGGILLTDNQDIYERAVLLGHNLKRPAKSVKNEMYKGLERTGFGLKLRMHPLAAVMILHQLEHYCFDWIKSRNATLSYFEKKLEQETFFQGMAKREYVTSMGAWYGFYPRANFAKAGIDKEHFVTWMQEKGFQIKVPKSKIIPTYELFKNNDFKISNFTKYDPPPVFANAEKYLEQVIGFPTFTFYEYEIIDKYIKAIKEYYEVTQR